MTLKLYYKREYKVNLILKNQLVSNIKYFLKKYDLMIEKCFFFNVKI